MIPLLFVLAAAFVVVASSSDGRLTNFMLREREAITAKHQLQSYQNGSTVLAANSTSSNTTANSGSVSGDGPIPGRPDKPRVRREWRTLSDDMKNRVARAYWIMRNYTTDQGRALYGKHFINHYDMVMMHACTSQDPRCDQGHYGPHFMVFHRAYLLKYELSLLAIDPSIEALPYWHIPYDSVGGKYRSDPQKYIFSANYFGDYFTSAANGYAVTNGLFANWPVAEFTKDRFGSLSRMANVSSCVASDLFKPKPCNPNNPNSKVLLRDNSDCTPFVTRNPTDPNGLTAKGFLGSSYEIIYAEKDWQACIQKDVRKWMDWQNCIDAYHIECVQKGLGSTSRSEVEGLAKSASAAQLQVVAGMINATIDATTNVTKINATIAATTNGTIQGPFFCTEAMLTGLKRGRTTYQPRLFHSQGHIKIGGDFGNVKTSPNEAALFTAYHAGIDRNNLHWVLNTQGSPFQDQYYGYPKHIYDLGAGGLPPYGVSGPYSLIDIYRCGLDSKTYPQYDPFRSPWIPGSTLNDVLNAGFPFYDLFDEYDGGAKGYTIRDILYFTTFERTPYTYDSLEYLYN